MVTAFMGVMGSGKDHRAKLTGHMRIDFKDELVDMCSDVVGWDIRQEYDWFKGAIVGFRKPANLWGEAMARSEMNGILADHPDTLTGRKLLQRLGTEAMRKRDPDYWVKQWTAKVCASGGPVATADCRFPNEVDAVARLGGRIVFCDYHSGRYSAHEDHESERLAQALLRLGLKDGEEVLDAHLAQALGAVREAKP